MSNPQKRPVPGDGEGPHDPPTPSGARRPRRGEGGGRGPEPGMLLAGKYRLGEQIKQGGMGSVWVATHLTLDTQVAIKFIDRRLLGSEDSASSAASDTIALTRARFEREAKAAAQLRMSNVVQVLDYGVDEGLPYLVMELLRGEDLGARLRRVGRLSPLEASRVLEPVARALQIAHDMGLVHRDLKPANIFLAREGDVEVPKVLDFGIAKAIHGGDAPTTSDSTTRGTIIGTPHYASPEQLTGKTRVDNRSDLWSLGVVAYRALTGKKPFHGRELLETVVEVCSAAIPPPTSIAPDLPAAADAFFERALAREPDRRFQSARELAAALAALAGLPVQSGERLSAEPPIATRSEPLSSPPDPPTMVMATRLMPQAEPAMSPPVVAPPDAPPPDAAPGAAPLVAPGIHAPIAPRRSATALVGVALFIVGTVALVAVGVRLVASSGRAAPEAAASAAPLVADTEGAAVPPGAPASAPAVAPDAPATTAATAPTEAPSAAAEAPSASARAAAPSAPSPRPRGGATAAPGRKKPQGEEVLGY